jgi:hypothetical protein
MSRSSEEIRKYFLDKGVMFASNGDDGDDSPLRLSISTYCDVTSEGNFFVLGSSGGRLFGKRALLETIGYASSKGFRYLVYIDSDCFIVSHRNLADTFADFLQSGCLAAGPSDGGVFCHRNGNPLSLNPFILFADVSAIAAKFRDADGKWKFDEPLSSCPCPTSRSAWMSNEVASRYAAFRSSHSGYHVPHADVISLPSNPNEVYYGHLQNPWSVSESIDIEPYYDIFLRMHDGKESLYFMYGRDFPCDADPSGITSAVYRNANIGDDANLVCLHSWFSRFSNSNGVDFERMTRKRIFSVGEYAKSLGEKMNADEININQKETRGFANG